MRLASVRECRVAGRRLLLAGLCGAATLAIAQPVQTESPVLHMAEWLNRVHAAPRQNNYVGTMVVSSKAGAMASARIWHACSADRQVERVDTLTGPPRTSVRRDDQVVTLLPDQKLVRIERHDALGRFPDLLKQSGTAIADYYAIEPVGTDRVAGFEAEVVQLAPKDALRFGYRVWTERRTGLVLKLQTLGAEGGVLEQAAFSELQLGVPLRLDTLVKLMSPPAGWRVERNEAVRTTASAEGWTFKPAAPGFRPLDCYRRGQTEGAMQCVFSDGLASVSLFVEPYDAQKQAQGGVLSAGATHTTSRRFQDWRITAVGEVPPQTLRTFVQSLERRP